MTVWMRELAGWLLVAAGLVAFVLAYDLLLHRRVFEAGPLTFIGFVVFRGGLHLLKVAVAARIASDVTKPTPSAARRAFPPAARPGTPTQSVVPGQTGNGSARR